jgi:hypothetical protein
MDSISNWVSPEGVASFGSIGSMIIAWFAYRHAKSASFSAAKSVELVQQVQLSITQVSGGMGGGGGTSGGTGGGGGGGAGQRDGGGISIGSSRLE